MRTIMLLTLLLVLRTALCSRRPASLPTEARQRLAAIRESFKPNFEAYHTQSTNENNQFLVMTVGDTGFTADDPLPLCLTAQYSFNLPQSGDARFLSRANTGDPHRGFLDDTSHRIRDIVRRYGDSTSGAGNVNIFIYNMPSSCLAVFTDTLVQLAGEYTSLTFHLGYEVALTTNPTLTKYRLRLLSRKSNIRASNIRGSVTYKVLRASSSTSGSKCWFNVTGDKQPMLLAANEQLHRGPLSQNANDAWLSQATTIGSGGPDWNSYRHLLLSPNGKLYGIHQDVFYTGELPKNDTMNWLHTARPIFNDSDIGMWALRVLFHPKGHLYWVRGRSLISFFVEEVRQDCFFDLGDPEESNAVSVEARVGATGWADFKFLTFDPVTGDLYGVVNGQLYAAPPPESPNRWTAQAAWLGTKSWDLFTHLFFDPHGVLYAVTQDGRLLAGPPPEYPTDCWTCRARNVSHSGWRNFKFLFFDPTEGSV